MSESHERTESTFCPLPSPAFDDEEPPQRSHRHPIWQDVSVSDWDDWRWQTQNAIRSVRQLRDLLPFSAEELEAIGSLEAEYKLAIPPYYFSLIDPTDPNDPIRLQSVPSPLEAREPLRLRAGRPARRGQGHAGAGPDAPLSRPGAAGHHARLHDVLPLLHPQAGDDGPRRLGRRQPQRRADDRVRPRPSGNPRRDRLRRRPADAAARQAEVLPRQPGGDPARRCHPHRHARAGHAAAEAVRRIADRPAGVGRQGVDPDALQPPARDHAGGGPRLQDAAPGRHAGQQPLGAAQGRQRRPRHDAVADARRCCASRSGRTTSSTAIRSSGPATSARRCGRAWRSWKACAAT